MNKTNSTPMNDSIEIKDLRFIRDVCNFSFLFKSENDAKKARNLIDDSCFSQFITLTDKVIGLLTVNKSLFDSDIFDFGIGKINYVDFCEGEYVEKTLNERIFLLQKCLRWIKQQDDLKCVIARVNNSDKIVFEKNDFHLVSTLLTFSLRLKSFDLSNSSRKNSKYNIRIFNTSDKENIVNISRNAFSHDHFHKDKNFPKNLSDKLFACWALNCCNGRSDCVLVANINGLVIGFITCKLDFVNHSKLGIIDLLAISPEYRQNGIGYRLVSEAICWFARNGAKSVIVGTQAGNLAAVSTYRKIGFELVRKQFTFHKWMDK